MKPSLLQTLLILVCAVSLLLLPGCGGGSRGTGGREVEGTVLRVADQSPVAGVFVTVAGIGEQSATTDALGRFVVIDQSGTTDLLFDLETENLSASLIIADVDPSATRVVVTINVDFDSNQAFPSVVQFERGESQDSTSQSTPSGSSNVNQNSSSGSDDDADDDDNDNLSSSSSSSSGSTGMSDDDDDDQSSSSSSSSSSGGGSSGSSSGSESPDDDNDDDDDDD